MKCLGLACVLALFPQAQESPEVARLIGRLQEDDIAQREAAVRGLVEQGEGALPRLREAVRHADPEVRERAREALGRIETASQIRRVCRELPSFDLQARQAPVGDLLREISLKTGASFADGVLDRGRTATVRMTSGTLMQALDLLCADLGDVRWSFEEQDRVRFAGGSPQGQPSVYSGRFRVSARRLDLYRILDAGRHTAVLSLYLEAQAEPGVRTLGTPRFVVERIVDDGGAQLAADPDTIPHLHEILPASAETPRGPDLMRSQAFTYRGLSPRAKRLASVKGRASFLFPLRTERIAFNDLREDSRLESGDFSISVSSGCQGMMQIVVERRNAEQPLDAHLDPHSIVLEDVEGEAYSPPACDVQTFVTGPGMATCFISLGGREAARVRRVKFDVVSRFYEKIIPFEFLDLPLP